jgi:hypothetical protein
MTNLAAPVLMLCLAQVPVSQHADAGTFDAGAGIVIGGEDLRLHLLDVHRFFIEGHSFNIYSIRLTIIFGK